MRARHPETQGFDAEGQVVDLPLHEHEVRLDMARFELNLQSVFHDSWAIRVFLPYEQKDQSVAANRVDFMDEVQWAAAARGSQVHHRTEKQDGFTDGALRWIYSRSNLFTFGDQLVLSPGLSLPFGDTAEKPEAETGRHFLLQFGSGTYDPVLDLSYYVKISPKYELAFSGAYRRSLDTNDKGYRAGSESSLRLGLSRHFQKLRLTGALFGLRTGFATWSGQPNYNTGIESLDGSLGANFKPPRNGNLNLTLSLLIDRRNRSSLGESFDRGPTVYLGYSLPLSY